VADRDLLNFGTYGEGVKLLCHDSQSNGVENNDISHNWH
jgi:hypothetical protein